MARKKVKCVDCGFLSLIPPKEIRLVSKEERDFYGEFTNVGREHVIQENHTSPHSLTCRRLQWNTYLPQKLTPSQIFNTTKQERGCLFFISYQPGYSPNEHRELQREKDNQRTIFRASIIGAAIGASAAILAQLIWALFSN